MSGRSLFQPSPPDVGLEIDATHVAAARMAWRGATGTVTNHVSEPLPPGAVVPSLASMNITDPAVVGRVLTQALARLGGRASRVALVIPDTAAKVSLIRFEKVPPTTADLAELVRWQVRKSAPFPIEQAVVSFTPGAKPAEGGQEYLVTVARGDIIQQYEDACARAGVHAGLIDIATSSVINAVLTGGSAPTGDWLLVHATDAYTTLAVIRGGDVIFFRNRERDSEGTLADVVHQTAMYYEDRLHGAGFSRVLLAGGAVQGVDAIRHSLEQRLDVRIESVTQPELAALTGILGRERKAA
jgi:type IV pilus assembly protein PilM